MTSDVIAMPQPTVDWNVVGRDNIFRDLFGGLDDEQWLELLKSSITTPLIHNIEFPRFPSPALQEQIHGHSNEQSLREALDFYAFIKQRPAVQAKMAPGSMFLDFGAGWGRISRMFLRDFDLVRMYAFEPHFGFCIVARSLNPYCCFLTGGFLPDNSLPADRFDVVVGWSVFSHLSELSATAWLEEMARIMRPDGYCVFSTWGERFLDRLITEQDDLAAGKEIHWYSEVCLRAAGNIRAQREKYLNGDFVWFGEGPIKHYGDACCLHPAALLRMINRKAMPFDLIEFDRKALAQDVFILRRR